VPSFFARRCGAGGVAVQQPEFLFRCVHGLNHRATTPGGTATGNGRTSMLGTSGQLAKIRGLGRTVDALVLSIGGNDIGFAGIVTACMSTFWPCNLDPNVTGPTGSLLADLPRRLDQVFMAVNAGAAGTVRNVFVTEYPDPTTGPTPWWVLPFEGPVRFCGHGVPPPPPIPFFPPFYPTLPLPGFQGFEGIIEMESGWASGGVVAPLNAALASAVARANSAPGTHPVWRFVTGISSRFSTHGFCTGPGSPFPDYWGVDRFVGTVADSLVVQGDIRGAMHPNDLGQQQIAAVLASALAVAVPPAVTPPPPPPPPPTFWCIQYDDRGKPHRVPCN
jgi:hypothetical protein